jgi:IS605 OrfB family transposase
MKLTAKVKLLPTPEQADYLRQTLEVANTACDYISNQAWDSKTFRQFPLHKLVYHDVRDKFLLTAQVVVRCISKVADAYKLDRETKRTFRPHGAVAFDNRILSYSLEKSNISIWTFQGRQVIPFVCGTRDRELLSGQRGESDLCLINGKFYLFAACDVETPAEKDVDDFLGVDLGIVNLASDSDGENFSGGPVEDSRRKYAHRRRNLQRKGTKAAKRKLRKLSGRQARFQKHTNHVISKRIVQKAQDTGRGIALEDLKGIRDRATVRAKQRARHANWAFYQLRQFVDYKAQRAGVPVILVDPRNTSRTCPVCGCVDKHNRPSQARFSCIKCGYAAPADTVAAVNIAARAAVTRPLISDCQSSGIKPTRF